MTPDDMTPENLPTVTHSGKMKIAEGFEIDVHRLDNGQSVITAEGMDTFLRWLESGGLL